ncbi:hypothetical protein NJ76_16505 [Rhodococcus sp. IITR03]|nr:hypothetical protein NJ76_16505 [Rhodococcus sp. IITR03]
MSTPLAHPVRCSTPGVRIVDFGRPSTSANLCRVSATTLPRIRHELALIAVGMPSVADIDCCR